METLSQSRPSGPLALPPANSSGRSCLLDLLRAPLDVRLGRRHIRGPAWAVLFALALTLAAPLVGLYLFGTIAHVVGPTDDMLRATLQALGM